MTVMEFNVKSTNKVQKRVGMEQPRTSSFIVVSKLELSNFMDGTVSIEYNRYHLKWFRDNREDCGRIFRAHITFKQLYNEYFRNCVANGRIFKYPMK